MADGDDALNMVGRLLDLLEKRRPLLTARPVGTPRQLAAGGLARGEGLLRGLLLVLEAEREDLAGLFIRGVWECWCVGLYALLFGQQATDELEEKHRRWLRDYLQDWPSQLPSPEVNDRVTAWLNRAPTTPAPAIWKMASRVEELLQTKDTGTVRYSDVSSYGLLYRLESHFSAHANYASFGRYLDPPLVVEADDPDGIQQVVNPAPNPTLRERAAPVAASYLAHLARHVYREFGISTVEIDNLLVRLLGGAGMLAHRPTE